MKKNQIGKNNPNFKHGNYIENRCICGNLMAPKSKQCSKCYLKSVNDSHNGNFKDGRTLKKYYCIDCGKEVTIICGIYGPGKCRNCSCKKEKKSYYCKCGTEISYNSMHYGNNRCSVCAGKSHSILMNGNKNPNWIDGRSYEGYPTEFNQELKESIRNRDNHECQNCGMTEEEHLIVYGRVLDVHHIDYNKQNCKEDNLISLCTGCNLRANWNRTYWKEFYTGRIKCQIDV
jgi:5-methylcytosine-specific restriction endonuclease McrA